MGKVSVNESPVCKSGTGLRINNQQLVKVLLKLKLCKQLI